MGESSEIMVTTLLFLFLSPQARPLDADALKLFAWFDGIGYTQYLSKPFVHVEPRDIESSQSEGFLISDTADSFEILTLNQAVIKHYKNRGNQGRSIPSHSPVNLATYMRETIRVLKLPDDDRWTFYSKIWHGPLASIGWTCHHIGLDKEAAEVMAMDEANTRDWYGDGAAKHTHKRSEYIGLAKEEVMEEVLDAEYQRFEDENMTRVELCQYLADKAKRFSGTKGAEDFTKAVAMLRSMIDEEKTYKPDLTTENGRIAHLIWRLRDDNEGIFSFRQSEDNAKVKLEQLGMKAVPQLIDAIKDRRFTRGLIHPMSGPRMMQSFDTVYRVGDVVVQILDRIAHQSFYGGTIPEKEAKVRNWFKEVSGKGEKQLLTERARLGDFDGYQAAKGLAEKYPADALAPIMEGYSKSKESTYRRELIHDLESLPPAKTEAFFRSIVLKDKDLEPRIEAIKLVARTAPEEAVIFAKSEWAKVGKHEGFNSGFSGLVEFTYDSHRADLVELMAKHLPTSSVDTRYQILRGGMTTSYYPERRIKASTAEEAKFKAAVEDMMASLLNDQERCNVGMSGGNYNLNGPKILRLAVLSLSEFMPRVYSFNDTKSLSEQERQRFATVNKYNSRRGKPALVVKADIPFKGPAMAIASISVLSAKSAAEKQTATMLQKYQSKMLNHTSLAKMIRLLAKHLAGKQTRALSFRADRDAANPGFRIVVEFRDDVRQGVGECVLEGESSRGMKAAAAKYLGPWEKDLLSSLDDGFNAPPDKNVQIEFELDIKPDDREG
jgi:hypothetical protein